MILDDFLKSPIESYIYAERYVNLAICFNDVLIGSLDPKYSSFHGNGPVSVDYLGFNSNSNIVNLFESPHIREDLKNLLINEKTYFPFHPQFKELNPKVFEHYKNLADSYESIDSIPTASMRTLFDQREGGFFSKTHFPGRISSSQRPIKAVDINRGLWVSNTLFELSELDIMPSHTGFQADILGMSLGFDDSIGAIIRDSITYPVLDEKMVQIPLSSLFSKDKFNQHDSLIVEQLADYKNLSVENYVSQVFMPTYLASWFWLASESGIIFSPHGQNAILEFDKDFDLRRIVHKDFQGRRVLYSIREEKGLSLPEVQIAKEYNNLDEGVNMALAYDFVIGEIFLDRSLEILSDKGYNVHKIISATKLLFNDYINNSNLRINKTRVAYKFIDGEKTLVDLDTKPKYRE